MMDFVKTAVSIFSAQFIIMCGIYFMSQQLLPSLLAPLYGATNYVARLTIGMLIFFTPANVIMAYAFGNFPPNLTAPMTMFAIVTLQVMFAVTIFKMQPSFWLMVATLATAASCMWVSLLLQQKPPV